MTFKCLECGKKFRTVAAAEKAAYDGCPGCGGVDVDIDNDPPASRKPRSKTPVQTDDGPVYWAS